VFVAPLFYYGLIFWISKVSKAILQALNALLTKFLKMYLSLPASERPFSKNIKTSRSATSRWPCVTGESLAGMKLSFLGNEQHVEAEEFNPIPLIPIEFWSTRIIVNIPTNVFYRNRLMREIFDMHHLDICTDTSFHVRY